MLKRLYGITVSLPPVVYSVASQENGDRISDGLVEQGVVIRNQFEM